MFVNGHCIGGGSDTKQLHQQGKLVPLIEQCASCCAATGSEGSGGRQFEAAKWLTVLTVFINAPLITCLLELMLQGVHCLSMTIVFMHQSVVDTWCKNTFSSRDVHYYDNDDDIVFNIIIMASMFKSKPVKCGTAVLLIQHLYMFVLLNNITLHWTVNILMYWFYLSGWFLFQVTFIFCKSKRGKLCKNMQSIVLLFA